MRRTAYTTSDIQWLSRLAEWEGLQSIAAVHTQFTRNEQSSDEWHYYISSRKLSAEALMKYARKEWPVETMHWLLDVHFGEDYCRIQDEDIHFTEDYCRIQDEDV